MKCEDQWRRVWFRASRNVVLFPNEITSFPLSGDGGFWAHFAIGIHGSYIFPRLPISVHTLAHSFFGTYMLWA